MKKIYPLLIVFFVFASAKAQQLGCNANFGFQISGQTVYFSPAMIGQHNFWDFGNGATSTAYYPNFTYGQCGTYTVMHIVSNVDSLGTACSDTMVRQVNIVCNTSCNSEFTMTVDPANPLSYIFNSPNVGNGVLHYWLITGTDFAYSATEASFPYTFLTCGTYNVRHIAVNNNSNCSDTTNQTLNVSCTFTCDATFATQQNGITVSFISDSISYTSSSWNFGDGQSSTASNPTHTYAVSGAYTVQHIVANGYIPCSDTAYQTIVVGTAPNNCNAAFGHQNTGNNYTFYPASTDSAYNHFWSFGDGSMSDNYFPTHIFTNGTFTVMHIVWNNNCSDTTWQTITVAMPLACNIQAGIYYFADSITNGLYHFNYHDSLLTLPTDSVRWSFGDNTGFYYGLNNHHQYQQSGTYNVCIRVVRMNGSTPCVNEKCISVVVNIPPTGCSLASPTFAYTLSGGNLHVENTTPNSTASDIVHWTFSDGSTATGSSINHQFAVSGNYTICMSITRQANGATCTKDTCATIQVTVPQGGLCSFLPVINSNHTGNNYTFWTVVPNQSTSDSIIWRIGQDRLLGSQVGFNFTNAGSHQVCLLVKRYNANGGMECAKDTCTTIWIDSIPNTIPTCNLVPNFAYHTDSSSNTHTINFINTSANLSNSDSTIWNFNDGTPLANGYYATHTFANNVNQVCMKVVREGCEPVHICKPMVINNIGQQCAVQIYPNPTNNIINGSLNLTTATTIKTRVVNSQGLIVRQLLQAGVVGGNTVTINVSSLPSGIYRISFVYGNMECSQHFFKY